MSALPLLPSTPDVSAPTAPAADAAVCLLEAVLQARDSRSAARELADRLHAAWHCRRVSVALWQDGPGLVLAAQSQVPVVDTESDGARARVGAMSEALEQGELGLAPAPVNGAAAITTRPLEGDRLRWELDALQARIGGRIAVLPLGQHGQPVAAVLMEWDRDPVPTRPEPSCLELEALAHELRLALPMLRMWTAQEAPWPQRLRRHLARGWLVWRQPERRRRRQGLALIGSVLLGLAVLPLEHRVGGRARIEGEVQRVLTAPVDGFLKAAQVRPGDQVQAGAVLAELVDRDLLLAQERWRSERAQHESAYAAAMARADRAGAALSLTRMAEAESQLALAEQQLERSRITAPFDGLVIEGDLAQAAGAPVKQGERLLTVAAVGAPRVVVEVDESEIAEVRTGQSGVLRVSAWPWDARDIVVERITPLAHAVEGRNVFDVQARLREDGATDDPALRPGLQGQARVVVGRAPWLLSWAGTWLRRARAAWWSPGGG